MILRWTPRQLAMRAPWRELERLRSHLEGMYETLSDGVESFRRGGPGVYPALNLSEDDDNLYVTAELPGVVSDDIELSVQGEGLTIRGERKIPEADQEVNYHRREREAGFFRRVINLPVKIDNQNVRASVKSGILNITLPKAVEVKPRQIPISID